MEHFGDPLGAKMAARLKKHKKTKILGSPGGSKMEAKSLKNLLKNRLDFCIYFDTSFSPSWFGFGSKNLSKVRSLRVVFWTSWRIGEKCDLKQPPYRFCYIFRLWERRFSTLKGVFFSCFFESDFKTYFFRFWVDFWWKIDEKSIRK